MASNVRLVDVVRGQWHARNSVTRPSEARVKSLADVRHASLEVRHGTRQPEGCASREATRQRCGATHLHHPVFALTIICVNLGARFASQGWLSTFTWLVLAIKEHRNSGGPVDPTGFGGAPPWRYDAPSRGFAAEQQQELQLQQQQQQQQQEELDTDQDDVDGTPSHMPINVLCMDGGGIRGRCLLAMVEEMEQQLGGPVAAHFDLIAGTSIGGCGSIFLSRYPEPGRATRMARLALTELQNRCFAQQNWRQLIRQGFLCRDERRELMLELCGPTQPLRLNNGPRAFAVAARRGDGGLEPFLFRTYDLSRAAARRSSLQGTAQVALWQAIEATSAAPVLFPRARLELELELDDGGDADGQGAGTPGVGTGGGASGASSDDARATASPPSGADGERVTEKATIWLADGGLVANDPTAIALREARALWPDRPIGTVMSLGTGTASPLGADASDEPARSPIGKAVRAWGGPSARYYRFNPPVRGVSMIDSNEDKLRAMEDVTRKFFRESLDAREACRRLAESRARRRSVTWRREWPAATDYIANSARVVRDGLLSVLMAWFQALLARAFAWRWALAPARDGHSTSGYRVLPKWHRRLQSSTQPAASFAMP